MKRIFLLLSCVFLFLSFGCKHPDESDPNDWVTKSDWLFLFYFDADNNLNDEIYANMRQAEYALSLLRNPDGTAKEGCPTVTMVALWDGESKTDAQEYGNRYLHPAGAVYELGADYDLDYYVDEDNKFQAGIVYDKKLFNPDSLDSFSESDFFSNFDLFATPALFGDKFKVGANTIDRTELASWLISEPKMGDVSTLTNFLTWAKSHYSATHVVLCLGDHGAGTGKEQYTNTSASARTLCADDSSLDSERMLSTKNIRDALTKSGYTGACALDLLWMDVCLQSTVEIAYDLRGTASYLLASSNLSVSQEYSHAFKNLTTETTPLDFGKIMVSNYYHANYAETMPFDDDLPKTSGGSLFTQTLIDLDSAKLEAVKSAVDDLADALLSLKETDADRFNSVYEILLSQNTLDFSECTGLSYAGTYAILSDIGYFTDGILSQFSDQTGVCEAARSLQTALDTSQNGAIVYAYGSRRALSVDGSDVTENQMYMTGKTDFLTNETVEAELSASYYGLTIETQNAESEESVMAMIAMYIKELTDEEPTSTTFYGLCEEFKNALVVSGYCSDKEAVLLIAELKNQLGAIDYVSHYEDYTGFSDKWASVIAAWYVASQSESE